MSDHNGMTLSRSTLQQRQAQSMSEFEAVPCQSCSVEIKWLNTRAQATFVKKKCISKVKGTTIKVMHVPVPLFLLANLENNLH